MRAPSPRSRCAVTARHLAALGGLEAHAQHAHRLAVELGQRAARAVVRRVEAPRAHLPLDLRGRLRPVDPRVLGLEEREVPRLRPRAADRPGRRARLAPARREELADAAHELRLELFPAVLVAERDRRLRRGSLPVSSSASMRWKVNPISVSPFRIAHDDRARAAVPGQQRRMPVHRAELAGPRARRPGSSTGTRCRAADPARAAEQRRDSSRLAGITTSSSRRASSTSCSELAVRARRARACTRSATGSCPSSRSSAV